MVESIRRSGRNANRAVSYREVDSDDEDVVVDELLHVTLDDGNNEGDLDGEENSSNDEDDEYLDSRKRGRTRRSANLSSNKRRRKSPTLEEREQLLKENSYYTQLASPDVDISELAMEWLSEFEEDSKSAVADMLNLILRSAGALYLFSKKDMSDLDRSTDVTDDIVGKFSSQGKHKYPFKLIPLFRNNVLEFFNQIIIRGHENGMLYHFIEDAEDLDDEPQDRNEKYSPVMENILVWISGLNSCTVRPLRYISTAILLKILCRLAIIMNSVIDSLEKAQKQLSKIKKSQKTRGKAISDAIETSQREKEAIALYLKDIVSACLIHRYRDIDDAIRQECIKLLGECMLDYPEFFLQPVYLRYFGWLLADPSSNVKSELTRMLLKIYKKFSQGQMTVSNGVSQFTQRYKSQLIKMSLLEEDPSVRIHAVSICCELLKIGFLNEEENLMVISNLFYLIDGAQSVHLSPSNLERLKTELSKFIVVWNEEQINSKLEKYGSVIENYTSPEFENDPNASGILVDGKLSIQTCLKYKELITILRQSLEYYLTEEPDSSIENKLPIAQIFAMLQRLPPYQNSWEFLITYLFTDTSSISFTSSMALDSNPFELEELKAALELEDETNRTFLLSFVHGLIIHFLGGKLKAREKEVASKNILRLMQYLAKLQKFLMVSEERVQIFVNIWNAGLSNTESDFNFYLVYKSLGQLDDYNEVSESLLRYYYVFENGSMDSSNVVIREFDKYFQIILQNYDAVSTSAFIDPLTPSLRISVQDLAKDFIFAIADLLDNTQDSNSTGGNSVNDDELQLQQQLFTMLEDVLSPLLKLQKMLGHAALEQVLEQRDPTVATSLAFNIYYKIDFVTLFGRLHDEFIPISTKFSKWLAVAFEFNITCLSWQLERSIDKLTNRDNAETSTLTSDEVRNTVDSQRAMIKRLCGLLDDLEIVLERIHDSSEDAADASNSLTAVFKLKEVISVTLMDILSLIKVFYLRVKEFTSSITTIIENNEIQKYVQGYIPIEIQRSILSVALYHEHKIANLADIDLDRSIEEGVNYYDLISIELPLVSNLAGDEAVGDEAARKERARAKQVELRKRKSDLKWEYEQEFCVYIFRVFKLMKLAMVNDFVFERLQLNSEKLGSVCHRIISLKNEELKKAAALQANDTNVSDVQVDLES